MVAGVHLSVLVWMSQLAGNEYQLVVIDPFTSQLPFSYYRTAFGRPFLQKQHVPVALP